MWCGSLWHTLPLPLPPLLPPVNLGSVSLMLHKKHSPPPTHPPTKRETQNENKRGGGGEPHTSAVFEPSKFYSIAHLSRKPSPIQRCSLTIYLLGILLDLCVYVCMCIYIDIDRYRYIYIEIYIPHPYCMYYCWQCWWTVCISDITLCHWFLKYQGWRLFQAR